MFSIYIQHILSILYILHSLIFYMYSIVPALCQNSMSTICHGDIDEAKDLSCTKRLAVPFLVHYAFGEHRSTSEASTFTGEQN